ncbi:MAG: hypothetical protein U0974_10400 [Gemmatimonadales bacterium]|nr:hypothetical protein [Gemmatimonadales bacterium]MDZ4390125.1 hypothetical protein [Gemmatimonadales bacterium]
MNSRILYSFTALTILVAGCSGSSTLSDIERFPNPTFTARLVTPDTVEFTIDNRASGKSFVMETCRMSRERLEGEEWKEVAPSIGDPLVQCDFGPGGVFPAGEVTTFRQSYEAIGSDGALERVRTRALLTAPGDFEKQKLWPDDAVPFFSEPFPGGVKE